MAFTHKTTKRQTTKESITRYKLITAIQTKHELSLDENDDRGWKIVYEELEKKKWELRQKANQVRNKYYQWWFREQNHIDPMLQKRYGPNNDKSIKDCADKLLQLADATNERWGFRAAIVPDKLVGSGTKESDVDPEWLYVHCFVTSHAKKTSGASGIIMEYLEKHGRLVLPNDCFEYFKQIDPNTTKVAATTGCNAAKLAKNLFLEVAGVNLVGTKREEFPTDRATLLAAFNSWLDEDQDRRQLLRAVQEYAAKQAELYKAWVETYTPWERDQFWLQTCDPSKRAYCEEMIYRFWKRKERCGCGKCDEGCASEMEWDHDEEKSHEFMGQWINGVEQKRLDEKNLGPLKGEPTRYNRKELIERRDISTIRCPDNHRFKNPIKIADPSLASKSYYPLTVTRYNALHALQTAVHGVKCLGTDREFTIKDFAVLEGHHATGKLNLIVGDVEYETAKLFERRDLYATFSGSYKEWKEDAFPEIPKLCHLHRKVHKTIEFLLCRLDLVLEMLRDRGVEIDWPYEIKGNKVVLQERWSLIEIQSEADMRAKDALKCLQCDNTAFGTYQSNHTNGWYGCLQCIKR